ncbi:hypothetical protein KAU08_08060 [bacterium]|nr:hypothetical protein [bacterium]
MMRFKHIKDINLTIPASSLILVLTFFIVTTSLTCGGGNAVIPDDDPDNVHDPLRPTIESFTAQRDGSEVTNNIVYSTEEITFTVQATSQAWPESCGLTEGDTVTGNLIYTFQSTPPEGIDQPGLISQSPNPSNVATWRVPELAGLDPGEGLLYTLGVTVFDECLAKTGSKTLTFRAFANQGPPVISAATVKTEINSGSPVTESVDQNGYFEVERGDECEIAITAEKRTSDSICRNHGVPVGNELRYTWSSTYEGINLTHSDDPFNAPSANFDIPITIGVSATFRIDCIVTDECVGLETTQSFDFLIIGKPEITSIGGTANGELLTYDPYFDHYIVLPGDEIILGATGIVQDSSLCIVKGISPDIEWLWQETTGFTPEISPEFEPFPENNGKSEIEFVAPAADNGTRYSFLCTVTDQCNGLTDQESRDFLVIVHPQVELTSVLIWTSEITPSPVYGRYEISPGNKVTVNLTGTAESSTNFCEARGISQSPPLMYAWNDLGDLVVLNYDPTPSTAATDLVFVVPEVSFPFNLNMTCVVKDLCNELESDITVKFRIVIP